MLSSTHVKRYLSALAVVASVLSAGPVAPAMAQSAPVSRPVVNVLCRLSDGVTPGKTAAQVQDMFSDVNLGGYFREMSNNALTIAGTTTVGWKALGQPKSYYMSSANTPNDYQNLGRACAAAADADVNFAAFRSVNLFFNTAPGVIDDFTIGQFPLNLDGVTTIPVSFLTDRALYSPSLIAHEMGHGFGMGHGAGGPDWDPMDAAVLYGPLGPGYNGYHRYVAGWIPTNRRVDLSVTPVAALTQLTQPNGSNPMLATYPLPGGELYTVEYRRRVGFDSRLPDEGVLIYRIHPGGRTDLFNHPEAFLQSAGGGTGSEGVLWRPGETFSDPANNIQISVLSVDGGVAQILAQPAIGVPTPPTNPHVIGATNTSVSIGWDSASSTLTHIRWRASGTTDAWQSIYVLSFWGGATINNLSSGFSYDVAVQGCFGDGTGLCGADATLTATASGALPAAPDGLYADSNTANGFTLHWVNHATNAQRNEVWIGPGNNGSCSFNTPINLPANSTSYAVTGMSPSTTYCASVHAVNGIGVGQTWPWIYPTTSA